MTTPSAKLVKTSPIWQICECLPGDCINLSQISQIGEVLTSSGPGVVILGTDKTTTSTPPRQWQCDHQSLSKSYHSDKILTSSWRTCGPQFFVCLPLIFTCIFTPKIMKKRTKPETNRTNQKNFPSRFWLSLRPTGLCYCASWGSRQDKWPHRWQTISELINSRWNRTKEMNSDPMERGVLTQILAHPRAHGTLLLCILRFPPTDIAHRWQTLSNWITSRWKRSKERLLLKIPGNWSIFYLFKRSIQKLLHLGVHWDRI